MRHKISFEISSQLRRRIDELKLGYGMLTTIGVQLLIKFCEAVESDRGSLGYILSGRFKIETTRPKT